MLKVFIVRPGAGLGWVRSHQTPEYHLPVIYRSFENWSSYEQSGGAINLRDVMPAGAHTGSDALQSQPHICKLELSNFDLVARALPAAESRQVAQAAQGALESEVFARGGGAIQL